MIKKFMVNEFVIIEAQSKGQAKRIFIQMFPEINFKNIVEL